MKGKDFMMLFLFIIDMFLGFAIYVGNATEFLNQGVAFALEITGLIFLSWSVIELIEVILRHRDKRYYAFCMLLFVIAMAFIGYNSTPFTGLTQIDNIFAYPAIMYVMALLSIKVMFKKYTTLHQVLKSLLSILLFVVFMAGILTVLISLV